MDAGKLKHRIALTPKSTIKTTDADGFITTVDAAPRYVWAARENLHGSEFFAAARVTGKEVVKFTIRYRADVDRNMTVTDRGGKVFNILYADDIKGNHVWMELMCEAVT